MCFFASLFVLLSLTFTVYSVKFFLLCKLLQPSLLLLLTLLILAYALLILAYYTLETGTPEAYSSCHHHVCVCVCVCLCVCMGVCASLQLLFC